MRIPSKAGEESVAEVGKPRTSDRRVQAALLCAISLSRRLHYWAPPSGPPRKVTAV